MEAQSREILCQCKEKTEIQTLTEWCITCNLPFCRICIKIHDESYSKKDATAKHRFLCIKTICSQHSEELTHFCSYHGDVCCMKCIREIHENCEELHEIRESLGNVPRSTEFYEVERALGELTKTYENLIDNRKNNIKTIEEQTKLTIVELKTIRKDLVNGVNFLVDDLIGMAEHFGEVTVCDMNKLVKEVKESQEHVQSLQTSFTKMKDNFNNLQIYMAMKQINSELTNVQNEAEDLCKQEGADETLAILHINSHFQDIISGSTLLGEIKILRSPCEIQVGSWKYRQAQQMLVQSYPHLDMLTNS